MRHHAIILLSLAALAMPPVTASAQQTRVITAEKANEYGLVYSLPKTALSVRVKARRQTFRTGKYYQYAKKYLGTDNVVKEDSEKWEILDVDVTPYGVADDETQYLMQLKPGATTFIGVDENGMLLSINAKPQRSETPSNNIVTEETALPDLEEYLRYADEDFLASQSMAKQAETLATSLLEVRRTIRELTDGTADPMPADGRQMELMLASLNAREKALARAFSGASAMCQETRSFSCIPEKDGKTTLFRLSDFAGFVEPDDFRGDPVYLTVKVTREGKLPLDINGVEKKFPKDGVVYAIPGSASVTLSYNGERLWNDEMEFAQFGTVFGLNPTLFTSRKQPSFATFSDVTGGLLELGTVTE